jgi:predicted transcriptional regulator
MRPVWAEIEKELPALQTQYFDIDENADEAKKWGVTDEIPMFIFLDKAGHEFARKKGQISKKELLEFIEENKEK